MRPVTIGSHESLWSLNLILFLAAATAAGFLINSVHAATPDEQAVLAPIAAMFDAMAKRDATAMKKSLLPGGGMVLMRDGKPTQITFDAFADLVGKPGKSQMEERIHDPLVRIDNDLAVVWARLNFWWIARWTTAERICSTLFAAIANGPLRAWQIPDGRIVRGSKNPVPSSGSEPIQKSDAIHRTST